MPIFEYRCKTCKTEFEKLVFANDRDKVCCPDCHGDQVQKKMSAASIGVANSSGGCSPGKAAPFR